VTPNPFSICVKHAVHESGYLGLAYWVDTKKLLCCRNFFKNRSSKFKLQN